MLLIGGARCSCRVEGNILAQGGLIGTRAGQSRLSGAAASSVPGSPARRTPDSPPSSACAMATR
jgi:hypothetical protein